MAVINYAESSAKPYWHTLSCILEQGCLYRYRCENLKSVTGYVCVKIYQSLAQLVRSVVTVFGVRIVYTKLCLSWLND
jgi:hypothetical protein